MDLGGTLQEVDLEVEPAIALLKLVLLDDMLQRDYLLKRDRGLGLWKRYRDLLSGYWMLRLVSVVGRERVLMKLVRRMWKLGPCWQLLSFQLLVGSGHLHVRSHERRDG